MGSDFLRQFMAGWGMGQQRLQNQRSAEQEAYNRQQDEFKRQQDLEERAIRMEALKFQKQQADQEIKRQKLQDAFTEHKNRMEAAALQNSLPTPTAAEVGIPEQGPEFGGPMASEVQVPQPTQALPSLTGGPDIPLPVPTGLQQQALQQQEAIRSGKAIEFPNDPSIPEMFRGRTVPRTPVVEAFLKRFIEGPKLEKVDLGDRIEFIDPTQMQAGASLSKRPAPKAPGESGSGKGLSQYAESNVINRLSNQWSAATKSSGEIARQVSVMETGLREAEKGNLAAGSQAILVTFQKILDPTSVVRESEYARSAEGQSLLSRMKGYVERLQKGGAGVPLDELEKYAQVARELAKGQLGHVNATKERIGKVADRYNIPRELVLENYDYGAALGEGNSGGVVEWVKGPDGKPRRK